MGENSMGCTRRKLKKRLFQTEFCVVFIIIFIIVSLFVIIRIIAVVVRIQPFVLKGTCLSHFDIIFS